MPTRSKTKAAAEKKKKKVSGKKPYIRMVFEAICHTRHAGKGVSRAKIANYIKANYGDTGIAVGAQFNTCLRKSLQDGIARGVLEFGATEQRYKITNLGRRENKESSLSKKYDIEEEEEKERKEKKAKKKAEAAKKKKAADKKKKAAAAKKKKAAEAKKKKASSKKKTSSSKKKASSKKKTTTTRRTSKRKSSAKSTKATRKSSRRTRR